MMKINIMLWLLLGVSLKTFGQQDPMYSQYVFNGLIINPAYAGTSGMLSASFLYRNQWVNMPGAPKTGLFSIDAPMKNPKVGLGLNLSFDKIGVSNHTGISGVYSYKIKFNEGTLSFGVQAGIGFSKTLYTSVKYSDAGQVIDDAFQSNYHNVLPNFGFGMYYYTDRFYAGFSIPQIAGKSIQKALSGHAEAVQLDLANHYFLTSGYVFSLSPDIKLKPSLLLKYVAGAPLELDLNGVIYFYDLLALGISYRSQASVNFLAQIRISNQLYLGYAYEYATTSLNNYTSGSHEIMLRYLFDFNHAKIVTPRYF